MDNMHLLLNKDSNIEIIDKRDHMWNESRIWWKLALPKAWLFKLLAEQH